jgi:hypothetical protein
MWERWDGTWDELKTVPDEFIDRGQHVLVTVHYSARGRGSGNQVRGAPLRRLHLQRRRVRSQAGVQRAIVSPRPSGARQLVADGCLSRKRKPARGRSWSGSCADRWTPGGPQEQPGEHGSECRLSSISEAGPLLVETFACSGKREAVS